MTRRGGPGEASISAREAEVLAALGEHLTNAEIAARLVLSVRTVESHVSSLLRKLGAADRRALAAGTASFGSSASSSAPGRAASVSAAGRAASVGPPEVVAGRRPARTRVPLTSFVGRAAERSALAEELAAHRLVTAVGPGGVGKTRLALRVVEDVADRYPDGAWFVDLVPATDAAMLAPAIVAALGLGEQRARSAVDTLQDWLATRETLLVLDNCEHLVDEVSPLVEQLLGAAPGLTVLATSRGRLMVPYERVFAVPGLSVEPGDRGVGDAVALFEERAAAVGGARLAPDDAPRVAALCRALDGLALAIELAAARLPSLGLDGLEAGLADRLRMLAGGRRVDERHRSLRSTLDWSHALLDGPSRAVVRRISVFAAPFSAAAAQGLLDGWAPVPRGAVPGILAGLAEQSLLVVVAGPDGTRYRSLETVRQYGAERLEAEGETEEAEARHVTWCLDAVTDLVVSPDVDAGPWRAAVDHAADESRAALTRAAVRGADRDAGRKDAHRLALLLAGLSFDRGRPGEAQRRYEQAADLADDDTARASALTSAAGAAEVRHVGDEALRLRRAAADAALQAGDRAGAAIQVARAAELISRGSGLIPTVLTPDVADTLLTEARALAGADERALAWVLSGEAFRLGETHPDAEEAVGRALGAARRVGDRLVESAALDFLTVVRLAQGAVRAAVEATTRRLELLAPVPMTAAAGMEFSDAFNMATDCAVAAGELAEARRLAERLHRLPYHREEPHLATSRLILVATLAGDWDSAIAFAQLFRDSWERAGRPRSGNLSRGAYAAATVHGLRGDERSRAEWLEIADTLTVPGRPVSKLRAGEFLDALVLLHQGRPVEAGQLVSARRDRFRGWHNGLWRPWHAALATEAAVLAGDVEVDLPQARARATDNRIAVALVDRASALVAADDDGLAAAASALDAAGCRYQWARTMIMRGGPHRPAGEAVMAALGATPMVWSGPA